MFFPVPRTFIFPFFRGVGVFNVSCAGDFFFHVFPCTGILESDERIPCVVDFEFAGKILCIGDFEFEQNFPVFFYFKFLNFIF